MCFSLINAQDNIVTVKLSKQSDSISLYSTPVLINTLNVKNGRSLLKKDTDYAILNDFKTIVFKTKFNSDSLTASFVPVPQSILKEQFKHKLYLGNNQNASLISEGSETAQTSDDEDLKTDGVLLRGISFGNSQDLVLNSTLNLRLGGMVGKDIKIEGAITDQEYPFQPDGTTSSLQDFDRIYLKISKSNKRSVLLGDYYYQNNPNFWFSKFSKKNRGMQISGTDSLKNGNLTWDVSGALARGRFARNEIAGKEGLQGPYRLTGTRNEQFIIIISGTEQIYLDGKKMERGLQNDYIIDYNSGEITFTPKHIITAFNRIVAEFQYSDRYYTRTVAGTSLVYESKKWVHGISIYSEQDAKTQPIQQELDFFDSTKMLSVKDILIQSGDNNFNAIITEVKSRDSFSSNQPNYTKLDSSGYKIYVYIDKKDNSKQYYSVKFNYVGKGNGNYIISATTANGKVFTWVKPLGSIKQGDYEPITQIQAPNRLTILESKTGYSHKNFKISFNASLSNNDKNTFSGIDDKDNSGSAVFLKISDKNLLSKTKSGAELLLNNEFTGEITSGRFSTIERYRSVEFNRDFSRSQFNETNDFLPKREGYATHLLNLSVGKNFNYFFKAGLNENTARSARFLSQGALFKFKDFGIEPQIDLRNDNQKNKANLAKISAYFQKENTNSQLTVLEEKSLIKNNTDTLLNSSFSYKEIRITENVKWKKINLLLDANQSTTSNVNQTTRLLNPALSAGNLQGEFTYQNTKSAFTKLSINQRFSKLLDSNNAAGIDAGTHTAVKFEWNYRQWLKIFSGNLFYQTLSGREQQRQFAYFEVPAGQGYFTWIDFNSNGIQEINEFQETPFKDKANFARLLVPTGQYIQAQQSELNGNLFTDLSRLKKWKSKFGKIQNKFTWNYNGKTVSEKVFSKLYPMFTENSKSDVLAYNSFYRNLIEFENQKNNVLVQIQYLQRGNKVLYSNGFDTRLNKLTGASIRLIPAMSWQIKLNLETKLQRYVSAFLPANSFNYKLFTADPGIIWQYGSKLRISANLKYSGKLYSIITSPAQLWEASLQGTQSISKTGILDLQFSFLNAMYSGNPNSPEGYDVLQGFVTGRNIRIQSNLRFNSGKNIQLLFGYDGRFNSKSPAVHVGRAEVRYLF